MTGPLLLRFAITLGASVSFYLLLSVVPLYARLAGPGGANGAAGLATGALMFSTVAGELVTPRLTARFGYRRTLAAGLILLGAPALALTASPTLTMILAVCVVRGLGFAITVVAGRRGDRVADPGRAARRRAGPGRRGLRGARAGRAAAGRVAGRPPGLRAGVRGRGHRRAGRAARPAGPARPAGRPPGPPRGRPCDATGGPAAEPGRARPLAGGERPLGVLAALRTAALLRPALVFSATTVAAGIIVTFLPLAMSRGYSGVAALALFAQPAAATLTRCLSGRWGDRRGAARLFVPGLVTAALGMLIMALTGVPVAVVVGSVIFGAGFGVAQNASLSLMYDRVPASGYDAVSALWNLSYDAGMGLGAVGFGLLAGGTGYPVAFAVTAAAMLIALIPARRDQRAPRPAAGRE